jgi:hypothetical protein
MAGSNAPSYGLSPPSPCFALEREEDEVNGRSTRDDEKRARSIEEEDKLTCPRSVEPGGD